MRYDGCTSAFAWSTQTWRPRHCRYSETPLNEDETDTLRAARDGGSVALMARKLDVSERVVRTRLWSAIGKTGARTRSDAIQIAEHNGWLLD